MCWNSGQNQDWNITGLTCVSELLLSAAKRPNHFGIEWSHHCLLEANMSQTSPFYLRPWFNHGATMFPLGIHAHRVIQLQSAKQRGSEKNRTEEKWHRSRIVWDIFFGFFFRFKIYDGFTTQAQEKPSHTKSLADNRQKRSIDGVLHTIELLLLC